MSKRRTPRERLTDAAFKRLARMLEQTPADDNYLATCIRRRAADYAADSEADQDIFPEGG